MGDEVTGVENQLEELAERVLGFQKYILRRAWGIYYSVWSFATLSWMFLPSIIEFLYPHAPSLSYFVAYSIVGIIAGAATARIFSNARRTLVLRRIVSKVRRPKRTLIYRMWWLPFYGFIILAFIFVKPYFYTLLMILLVSVDLFVYYELKASFSRIPPEGLLAIASFAASIALGLYASLVSNSYLLFGVDWLPMVLSWLFCSLYALYHAPDYMVE